MMKQILIAFLVLMIATMLVSCGSIHRTNESSEAKIDSIIPEYAKGFTIDCYNGYKVINISDPFTSNTIGKVYVSNDDISHISKSYIKAPISSVACMSSTHITFIDTLSNIDIVNGVSDIEYILNKKIQERYSKGLVTEVAQGMNVSIEKVIAINPDAMLVSPFKELSFSKLEEVGINIIPIADYLEPHPLGRLEWIKVIGVLLNKEIEAEKIYQDSRNRYIAARELAAQVVSKPTIFDGANTWGTWYISGGKSFMAYLYKDCGSYYVHSDNEEKGSSVINYETLYSQCHNTDYWRVALSKHDKFTLKELLSEDSKLKNFKAIKDGRVIFCNIKSSPLFEHGIIEPDVILRDLIYALHPEVLPDYQPVYYHILK